MAARRSEKEVRMLGLDDLVEAFFAEEENRNCVKELSSYFDLRLRLLSEALACHFLPRPGPGDAEPWGAPAARDRDSLRSIARDCLQGHAQLHPPFSVYLEGKPGPLETALRERHAAPVRAAVDAHKATLRATFAECLRVLEPELVNRTVEEAKLFKGGLPQTPPDPDDFW